ncbi:MAG: hypothetical protein ACOZBH_04435 [Patescibacteria group bacterium]
MTEQLPKLFIFLSQKELSNFSGDLKPLKNYSQGIWARDLEDALNLLETDFAGHKYPFQFLNSYTFDDLIKKSGVKVEMKKDKENTNKITILAQAIYYIEFLLNDKAAEPFRALLNETDIKNLARIKTKLRKYDGERSENAGQVIPNAPARQV